MALKIKVKAGSINNLTDARYFASYGVDWMGFCLDSNSDDYIEPELAKQIIGWLYGPAIVGEFGNQSIREINYLSNYLGLGYIQVSADFPVEDIGALDKKVLREVAVSRQSSADSIDQAIRETDIPEAYILNFVANDISWNDLTHQKLISVSDLKSLCRRYSIITDMPLNVGQLSSLLNEMLPYGINIRGSEEEKTGFKQFDELNELLEFLETET